MVCMGGGRQVVSLWIWLSHRFDKEYFPGRERALATSEQIIGYMSDGLERMFGPTAALTSPKAAAAACSKFATWTNGAKQPQDMVHFIDGGAGRARFRAVQRESRHIETEAA